MEDLHPDETKPTATQPSPNISTEHQAPGDARRPGETLDKDRAPEQDDGGRRSSLLDD